MQREQFERVKEGDPISAKQYNELLEAVEMLSGILLVGGTMLEGPFGLVYVPAEDPQLEFVQLSSDLIDVPHAATANELQFNDAVADGSDPWQDSGTDVPFVAAPHIGTWLTGERTVTMRHSAAGRNIMLPFTNWHLAVLDATLSQGSTATVSIWEFQASGLADSNHNEVAYDWLLGTGESLAAGTRVVIVQHRQSRNWIVVQAACAPPA